MQFYLMENLESRLEIIIWRVHFVLSVRNSQQLISHGHVYVNGFRMTKKNYLVKKGDIITFAQSIHPILVNYVSRSNLWPIPPKYLEINYRIFQIIVVDKVLYTNLFRNFDTFLNINSVIKSYKS
jgi:ribosomal protein S4